MIFPNRAPAPQMRPAMGYAPGSNAFGYVAHMGYAPGARTLGAISAPWQTNLLNAGWAQSDIDSLSAIGATDNDAADLLNGTVTLSDVYAKYVATDTTPAAASSAGPGQLPTGSVIQYQGGWTEVLADGLTKVQQALTSQLPGSGMQLIGFVNTGTTLLGTGPASFTAQIAITGLGFARVTDAQSIIVTIIQSVIGVGNLTTNQIGVVSVPPASGATVTAAPATDFTTWLENNALWIGGGVAALVLLTTLLGKRR